MNGKRTARPGKERNEPGLLAVLRTGFQIGFGGVIVVVTIIIGLAVPAVLVWAFFDSLF